MSRPVILTGIRSNENLQIGNYFGALLPIIDTANKKSEEFDINLFVPDLHSFTTPVNHSALYQKTLNNLRIYLAAGLPIEKTNVRIYRQSFIPAHSELAWIIDCFTGIGELSRMTQFKDKSSKNQNISVGLFNYPALMAADILLYDAIYVPVGDDQAQHLEFTRDIAQRINSKFNQDLFTIPKTVKEQHHFFSRDQGIRIMDLQDPSKKMSKSDESKKGVIFLSDEPEEARSKILSATTDSIGVIHFDKTNQPGVANLMTVNALLNNNEITSEVKKWEGKSSYKELKEEVADNIKNFLATFQSKMFSIKDEDILSKLSESEEYLRNISQIKLEKVQKAVGLRK